MYGNSIDYLWVHVVCEWRKGSVWKRSALASPQQYYLLTQKHKKEKALSAACGLAAVWVLQCRSEHIVEESPVLLAVSDVPQHSGILLSLIKHTALQNARRQLSLLQPPMHNAQWAGQDSKLSDTHITQQRHPWHLMQVIPPSSGDGIHI